MTKKPLSGAFPKKLIIELSNYGVCKVAVSVAVNLESCVPQKPLKKLLLNRPTYKKKRGGVYVLFMLSYVRIC